MSTTTGRELSAAATKNIAPLGEYMKSLKNPVGYIGSTEYLACEKFHHNTHGDDNVGGGLTVFADSTFETDITDITDSTSITNADFIAEIFRDLAHGSSPLVTSFGGNPLTVKTAAWFSKPWPSDTPPGYNNYLAFASYFPGADGSIKRKKDNFAALYALMLDDLGWKVPMARLGDFRLSWLLETSPGNHQGGIILADPITDMAMATRLLNAIIQAGLCDPGANGPIARLGRLPVGINGKKEIVTPGEMLSKPFKCRLVSWNPDIRYSHDEIVTRLQLEMVPAGRPKSERKKADKAPRDSGGDDVHLPRPDTNPVIEALQAKGLYKTPLGSGKHDITCPWVSEHTGSVDNGAAYFEPDDTYPLGGYHCCHSHGERLHIRDLLKFLEVKNSDARMKTIIRVVAGELHRVVDTAEIELAKRGRHYQAGGLIVSVATDPRTKDPAIIPTTNPALTRELSVCASFERWDARAEDWVRCDPPARHTMILYDSQTYRHLKPLMGLARQPFFRETGGLVLDAGYDEKSGMFGVFNSREYPIKTNPTRDDALAALGMLNDLLGEFRFASDADRAAALSGMLTAVVRPSLPNAPMLHVRAPVFGSGKSYLCKLLTAFATPGSAAPASYPSNSEEATKTLLALLLGAPAVIEFDDMASDLIPYGAMNRVLSEQRISDRILGESKTASVSTRVLFLSSGNNVGPIRDMLRRVLTIHIDPRCSTPATIRYKHGPVDEVRANRGKYVAAALTIILAWQQAGCPKTDVSPIATYGGAWADHCRHPLIWLGLQDPATALLEQLSHDPDADALGRILALWYEKFHSDRVSVADALRDLSPRSDLMEAFRDVADDKGELNRRRLGRWIQRHERRIVDGLEFRRDDTTRNKIFWRVVEAKESVMSVMSVSKVESAKTVSPPSVVSNPHPGVSQAWEAVL